MVATLIEEIPYVVYLRTISKVDARVNANRIAPQPIKAVDTR